MVKNLQAEEKIDWKHSRQLEKEVVEALKQTMDELKDFENLFQNIHRAVAEMQKEGMVTEKRTELYEDNPEHLQKIHEGLVMLILWLFRKAFINFVK